MLPIEEPPANDMEPKKLVWAKMKRYSPWPGLVVNVPSAELLKKAPKQKNVSCIFFFGTKNFAWIENANIKDFNGEYRDKLIKSSKTAAFRDAVARIEEYIADPIKYKANAEADPQTAEERNVDAEFNKLRASNNDDSATENGNADNTFDESYSDAAIADASSPVVTSTSRAAVSASNRDDLVSQTSSTTSSARKATAAAKKDRQSLPMKFKVGQKKPRESSEHLDAPAAKRKRQSSIDGGASTSAAATTTSTTISANDNNNSDLPDESNNSQATSTQSTSSIVGVGVAGSSGSAATKKDYRRNLTAAERLVSKPFMMRLEPEQIDLSVVSDELKKRTIKPSPLTFGFLGLGIMGAGMVKNLINTGHSVVVWNRTFTQTHKFESAGATAVVTPLDVIEKADITFSCVSNPVAAKEMVFGNCGILAAQSLGDGKGYVEMTGIDDSTSQDISDAITMRGGRYLEAQLQGSRKEAEDGTLVILAAGDKTLYSQCASCFEAMSKTAMYMGDVGQAAKMYVVLQMISGVSVAVLGEALALAQKSGLNQNDVLEVLKLTKSASPMLLEKGAAMVNNNYVTNHPLMHMQKDMQLALSLSEHLEQAMPITASANEVYKQAKRNGYSEHDTSAVYVKSIH